MAGSDLKKCSCCGLDYEFELDDFLLAEIAGGSAVVFAGAGVSTENQNSSPTTLYTEIAVALGQQTTNSPFSDLAETLCAQPDGRFKMMQIVQERFDYIAKFRDLRTYSRRFFDEIATMPYLNTFITTNWDRNFEECCAAKPFVTDPDMRFWDVPERKVLKIHGTIDDYSSIIATRGDYELCRNRLRTSLVGSKLKEILSTRTCIFVGYSLRDEDFREIYDFVIAALGRFSKQHFLVSPFPQGTALPANLRHIATDGTHFMRHIKDHMCKTHCYLPDDIYDEVEEELMLVRKIHNTLWEKLSPQKKPQMLSSACYQDGIIHAYQLILDQRSTGCFSNLHRIQTVVHQYEEIIMEYRKKQKFLDTAYFRGYQNALLGVTLAHEDGRIVRPPPFFYEGVGEMTPSEFYKNINNLPQKHKTAFQYLVKVAGKLADGMVLQHSPWG